MALTPLPPPAILKCGGHILLNAYMHAMRRPSRTTRWRCPWRWYAAPRMSRAAVTLDTVEIAGLIADDQRLFTPLAQVTPMTCKKAVFACLDTNVTFTSIYNSLRPVLRLRRDVEQASWRGQSRPRKRRHTESADCPHVRRYLNPFTATGYFDIPPPRWPTFLVTLFSILKKGMGLSLLDEFEVQYHVIKK